MGFLGKLFGHRDDEGAVGLLERESDEAQICLHTAAAPEWDNLDDMGKEDRIARFRCPSCGTVFSADEYRDLQRQDAERIARVMEPGRDDEQSG